MTSSKVSLIFSTNILTMKSTNIRCFGLYFLLATIVIVIEAHQICEPPDRPADGDYFKKQDKFQLGDEITYNCSEGYTLMGKDKSKCRQNGDWSNPTPFCDRKVGLVNSFSNDGSSRRNPEVIDGNVQTCSTLTASAFLSINLIERGVIFAIRIFVEPGPISIEVRVGTESCTEHNDHLIETKRWILLECNKSNSVTNLVKIQNKLGKTRIGKICEVEVYAKEEDGCDKPPNKRVSNGYFQVSRSMAKFICKEGYDYKYDSTRLICEKNNWIESNRFECYEVLCDPRLKPIKEPGIEWIFLDAVRKISVGTRRQLKCSNGYKKVGSPEIIKCEKNGTWTKTNATCIEILCDPRFKPSKGPGIEWVSLDAFQKASVDTRRQLLCSKGYEKVGSPEIIQCHKDGMWTRTNATCKVLEDKVSKSFTKSTTFIIIIVVGVIVVLIILALIGTTIYFVKKQRGREVVVVYSNPPTEGSVVSGSEIEYASGYYESIQDNTLVNATISKSTPQMPSDGYFLSADSKGTLKKPPVVPADIAFDSLKHCQLYK